VVWVGSHASLSKFFGLLVSQERLKLDSPVHAVRAVHSMQPSPNYFGLMLFLKIKKHL